MGTPEVSIRELRNHGGELVDRVAAGERLTVTRAGTPVAAIAIDGLDVVAVPQPTS